MNRRWLFRKFYEKLNRHRASARGGSAAARYRRLQSEPLEERVALAADLILTGAGAGGGPHVRAFLPQTLTEQFGYFGYGGGFTGGVRVASGDVNGDGQADMILTPGAGGGPHVRVLNGLTGLPIREFFAFEPTHTGGLSVASGDINNDNVDEVIVSADGPGGAGRVRVFNGMTGAILSDLSAPAPLFSTGTSVAAGDVTGDGRAEIIVGASAGSSPRVMALDAITGAIVKDLFAYNPSFTGGVYVAAGDVSGDGRADIITGPGAGGGPHVRVFDGNTLQEIRSFFAYNVNFTGGVRVAATDFNRDGQVDLMTGAGPGGGPHVRIFRSDNLQELVGFMAYNPAFGGGVFVGSSFSGSVTAASGVDLAGNGLNVVTEVAQWGTQITVQAAIRNRGAVATPAGFFVQWYLSRDAVGSADDVLLLRASGGGQSYSHNPIPGNAVGGAFELKLQLPAGPPAGFVGTSFHIVMRVDHAGQIAESNESNNFGQVGPSLDSEPITIAFTPPPPTPQGAFQIEINPSGLSVTQLIAFQKAADRWEQIITGDLSDQVFNNRIVDDLLIDASGVFIDGVGGILGGANFDLARPGVNGLPYHGFMIFDTADLVDLENNFTLQAVILHEMGHVLGIGTLWTPFNPLTGTGNVTGSTTLDPRFIGPQATAEYNTIFGVNEPGVPVENFLAGPGSGLSHWRERTLGLFNPGPPAFVNELMTPFIGPRFLAPIYLPLSRITAASLADLGYQVDLSKADLYFPLTGVQFFSALASANSSTSGSLAAPGLQSSVEEAGVGSSPAPRMAPLSTVQALLASQAQATDLLFAEDDLLAEDDSATLELLTAPISASPQNILDAALTA